MDILQEPYKRFYASLRYYLPEDSEIQVLSEYEEKMKVQDCIDNLKTFSIYFFYNSKKYEMCGMTRKGLFILQGKTYIWPWREVYCPNWIYKHKGEVEVWSAPLHKPWELYQGRLKILVKKDTLCYEGCYNDGVYPLKDIIEEYNLLDANLKVYLSEEERVKYHKLVNGSWRSKNKRNVEHPFLPSQITKRGKEIFLGLLLKQFLDDDIPNCNIYDINNKRIINVEWMIGHLISNIDINDKKSPSKLFTYMKRRIYSHALYIDYFNVNFFEYASCLSRVIRGTPGFGNLERRQIDKSHNGVYCLYRASEGENIGLGVDLSTGVKLSTFEKKGEHPTHFQPMINGCIQGESLICSQSYLQSYLQSYSPYSEMWYWNDIGRVIEKEEMLPGIVATYLIFKRNMPPVRSMYASTHLKQIERLVYPQRPLIVPQDTDSTYIMQCGCNAIVAVSGFYGFNIEDAIVINKGFLDRGGLSSFHIHSIIEDIGRESQILSLPNIGDKFEKLKFKTKDNKIKCIDNKKGFVTFMNQNNSRIHIRLEEIHKPEIGDKFSTRHGQKGVIGRIVSSEDLPYTSDGIIPDILINPAHLPSRMTVSQMLESFFGKEAIYHAVNATDASSSSFDDLNEEGREDLYHNGEKLDRPVFVGFVYYLTLQHMVYKKCRVRDDKGPVIEITGQPSRGKSCKGGLRIGEMERDAIRMRNNESVLEDRLMKSCDITTSHVCKKCGWLEPQKKCCENPEICEVKMPKSTQLMLFELYGLGIFPKLNLSQHL
tara:strand:+ start:1245 stop:3548 length:2304 start_codon:yes stop_codon:yes gene_type:complete